MAADYLKVQILKQYDGDPRPENPLDHGDNGTRKAGKIRLHDAGAPGEVILLSASVANDLIASGWAVQVA